MLVVAIPMLAPAASAQNSVRPLAPEAASPVAGAAAARLAAPRSMLIRGLASPPESARQAMVRPHPGFPSAAAVLLPPVASRVDAPIRELIRVQMAKKQRGRTLMIIGGTEGALMALGGVAVGTYGLIIFLDDSRSM
ncbi:MAG: hypothetical protein IIA27_04510 [Gemmatimonadetes bacterium]|nr:hypothetical protein [Gemmatimonadota bacterium]